MLWHTPAWGGYSDFFFLPSTLTNYCKHFPKSICREFISYFFDCRLYFEGISCNYFDIQQNIMQVRFIIFLSTWKYHSLGDPPRQHEVWFLLLMLWKGGGIFFKRFLQKDIECHIQVTHLPGRGGGEHFLFVQNCKSKKLFVFISSAFIFLIV